MARDKVPSVGEVLIIPVAQECLNWDGKPIRTIKEDDFGKPEVDAHGQMVLEIPTLGDMLCQILNAYRAPEKKPALSIVALEVGMAIAKAKNAGEDYKAGVVPLGILRSAWRKFRASPLITGPTGIALGMKVEDPMSLLLDEDSN